MSTSIFKSIGAVIAGFLVVAILSVVTDMILEKIGILPDATNPALTLPWMLVLALIYRSLFTMVGGYITAKLAPTKPMQHVYALMILGLLGGTAGAVSGWNLGNHWYPVLLAVTGPLFVFIGGKFSLQKK